MREPELTNTHRCWMHRQLSAWLRGHFAAQACISQPSGCSSMCLLPTCPALPQPLCAHTALVGVITPDKRLCFSKQMIAAKHFIRWEDAVILSHPSEPNLPSTALWVFNCRLAGLKLSDGLQTHRTQLSRCPGGFQHAEWK